MSYYQFFHLMLRIVLLKMYHLISYLHILFENVTFDGYRLPYLNSSMNQNSEETTVTANQLWNAGATDPTVKLQWARPKTDYN